MKIDEDKLNSNSEKEQSFSNSVDRLLEDAIPTMEVIFGRKLTEDEKKQIEKIVVPLKLPSQEFAREVENLKNGYDGLNLLGVSEDFISKIVPDYCQGESPLEQVRSRLFELKEPTVGFIKKSKYVQYLDCIRQIIDSGMGKGTSEVIAYMSDVSNAEDDIKAWGQAIGSSMGKIVKYLTRDKKRFSETLVTKCISDYGKMSGVYEKLVVIIAGFVSIEQKQVPEYLDYKENTLAKNIKIIENKGWRTITNEFDRQIRNSIAHGSIVRVPAEQVVIFSGSRGGKGKRVSYKLLFEKTRELACLVLALSSFIGLVYDALLRSFISSKLQLPEST